MGFFLLFCILISFLKYETIVSRNGLSLGYSEGDTSSGILEEFQTRPKFLEQMASAINIIKLKYSGISE